ncbi:MAG: HAD family hydrolase [Sciscionella sp.]
MAIRGVLIDFSGTLFSLDYDAATLSQLLGEHAESIGPALKAELLRTMTAPTAVHHDLTESEQRDWANRDLDPVAHQRANVAVLELSGVPSRICPGFYSGLVDPANWQPYPDAEAALALLQQAGIRIAVVSNIAWDIRACFHRSGLDSYIDSYVLSYEVGSVKPNPRIFTFACEALGLPARDCLMIGDSTEADGGARTVGARFAKVSALPVAQRPDALLRVLSEYGITG